MSDRSDALELKLTDVSTTISDVDTKLDAVAALIRELRDQTPPGEPALVTDEQFTRLEALVGEVQSKITSVDTEAGGLVTPA